MNGTRGNAATLGAAARIARDLNHGDVGVEYLLPTVVVD